MFVLQHFYVLLNAEDDLLLVNNDDGEIVYDGMMGAIPDDYDECEVTDFGINSSGMTFFEIEVI